MPGVTTNSSYEHFPLHYAYRWEYHVSNRREKSPPTLRIKLLFSVASVIPEMCIALFLCHCTI